MLGTLRFSMTSRELTLQNRAILSRSPGEAVDDKRYGLNADAAQFFNAVLRAWFQFTRII